MNIWRIPSAEEELPNKSAAVWSGFQNKLKSKLSSCKICKTRQLFLFKKEKWLWWGRAEGWEDLFWGCDPWNTNSLCGMVSRGEAAVQYVKCSAFSHIPLKHIPTHVLQSPLPNFYSSPSSASQSKYSDFALHEVFPLDSLVLHFWDILHLYLSGYKIIKIRQHIKQNKTKKFCVLNNWQNNFQRFVRSLLWSDLTELFCRAPRS